MKLYDKKENLKEFLSTLKKSGKKIGLVPTMGALHEGHISLVQQALIENDAVVVSIFVNPTQFNNPEDLEKYPRTLEADLEMLKTVTGNVSVYAPQANDVYDDNVASATFDFDGLEHQMEGAFRPGHFDGVGTVVKKLFEIVMPNKAYFGEKDFQQLQIIKKMVEKEAMPLAIVGCPILREANGLAMSSRNKRLSDDERSKSAFIFEVLNEMKSKFGKDAISSILLEAKKAFNNNDMFELEYVTIANEATLEDVEEVNSSSKYRAFVAVYVNNVRLIDNLALN